MIINATCLLKQFKTLCVSLFVCAPHMCRYPQWPEEGTQAPGTVNTDVCEPHDICAENLTPVLWKSSKCS